MFRAAIIRRINYITTTSGTRYMSLCIDDRLVHTKLSSIHSDIYQMSYRYN